VNLSLKISAVAGVVLLEELHEVVHTFLDTNRLVELRPRWVQMQFFHREGELLGADAAVSVRVDEVEQLAELLLSLVHIVLELLEVEQAVAVRVDTRKNLCGVRDGQFEACQGVLHLLTGDRAIVVLVI
jgi:hypothetical protein